MLKSADKDKMSEPKPGTFLASLNWIGHRMPIVAGALIGAAVLAVITRRKGGGIDIGSD